MIAHADLPLAGRIEILRQRLVAIAERMGETLARTAHSSNIKERRDHSCALFDARGRLLAQAAHIPVHLGSMSVSVDAARSAFDMQPGDTVILNDPYAGGTHLPDITLVSPICRGDQRVGFAANRAHHADVGGKFAGSMGTATHIDDEGIRLPPTLLAKRGRACTDVERAIRAAVRTPHERMADLAAQQAANAVGLRGLLDVMDRYSDVEFDAMADALFDHAERRIRTAIRAIPDGQYQCHDVLEGDGVSTQPIPICVTVSIHGDHAQVDFTGTSHAVAGCVNCPLAVTRAAVSYVFMCIAGGDVPHNAGMARPISVTAPEGCLVNARHPSAVAAGNVETSQRIVDVVFGALAHAGVVGIPAASAGTMSSLSLGGHDASGRAFTYYETIAGGAGASHIGPGESGIQTHMTNTRNTPTEALEAAMPIRVTRYGLSRGSGGAGTYDGGNGIVREFVALSDMTGAILADRHSFGPPGRNGGAAGRVGRATIIRSNGTVEPAAAKCTFILHAGDSIRIETPGGGGFGAA